MKYLNTLLTHYENRWKKEYLTELREHQKKNDRVPSKQIQVGDVVLISDDTLRRTRWRLGKVVELITCKVALRRMLSSILHTRSLR